MSDVIRLKGKLEEKRLKAEQARMDIVGLRDSIRTLMDKYTPVEELCVDLALDYLVKLSAMQAHRKELLDDISAMRRDLGMDT